MRYVETTGSDPVRLWVEERGTGPTLVLLNGMSQTTANWMTQVRHLKQAARVIAYDGRGQGRSGAGAGNYTLDAHVDDLLAVLDACEVTTASFVGFSHGARVALRLAALHPARVSRLVLTGLGSNEDALRMAIVRSWIAVLKLGGIEAMAWCALPDILGRGFLDQHVTQMEAMVRATVQRNTTEGLTALLEGLVTYPEPQDDARLVRCRTLLLNGAEDLLVDGRAARILAGQFARCRHQQVDNSGHTVPIEQPEVWRNLVTDFLELPRV